MKGAPGDNASRKEWVEYLTVVSNLRKLGVGVADNKLEHPKTSRARCLAWLDATM